MTILSCEEGAMNEEIKIRQFKLRVQLSDDG